MKRLLACGFLAFALVLTAAAADVSGKWSGTFVPEGGDSSPAYMILKQAGTSLTGSAGPNDGQQFPVQEGKIQDNKVSFQVTTDNGVIYKCSMVLEADHLTGDISATRDGQSMKGKIEMTRVK
jgi:hypothetical protein